MTISAGIWMDHRKAVTVILEGNHLDTFVTESHAQATIRMSVENHRLALFAHHDVVGGNLGNPKYPSEINHYFRQILDRIKTADELVLMGPGDVKKQFINFLIQQRSSIRLKQCKFAGTMTDEEVVQDVCQSFNLVYH